MRIAGRPVLVLAAGALALAACTPTTQSAAPDQRTREGAVTGALIGGLLGYSKGGDNRLFKSVAGAAIGAAAGGLIGQELDRQAAELRQQMQTPGVRIENTGSALIVTMPQDILFAVDSTTVRPDLRGDLSALAANLASYPDSRVEIIGHTDSTGDAGYNLDLSQRRATAVANVLRDYGVSAGRLVPFGRGEDMPVASNLTPEGRALNRRVEIIIRPNA